MSASYSAADSTQAIPSCGSLVSVVCVQADRPAISVSEKAGTVFFIVIRSNRFGKKIVADESVKVRPGLPKQKNYGVPIALQDRFTVSLCN